MARRYCTYCKFGIVALVWVLLAVPEVQAQLPVVTVGMVEDRLFERTDELRQAFQREILALTEGEFAVRFPAEKHIKVEQTPEGVRAALDRLLADPEVDIILAVGVQASYEACTRAELSKPVIAPLLGDARLLGISSREGVSGIRNLSYVSFPPTLARDLQVFREVAPFNQVAFLSSPLPEWAQGVVFSEVRKNAQELGVQLDLVISAGGAQEVLAALPSHTQAVYLSPLLRLPPEETSRFAQGLISRGLPSLSSVGPEDVTRGILASNAPPTDFDRLARRVAINLQRILLGEEAGSLPVAFARGERLTINMATARALGVYPPWKVLTDAALLNEERKDIQRRLSLEQAVQEAFAANLDLKASDRFVAAGAQEIRSARSILLPQLDVAGRALFIDDDRAAASFGSQAERTLTASLGLSQLLYSDPAWANLAIQKHLQTTREEEREQLRLDVTQDAATIYLNVLRAKTIERIRKDNLQLTRSNLERARIRRQIGLANPAEVFRWESQIATDRRAVLDATAQRRIAELALNRLLNRPLEEEFLTAEVGLDDPVLVTSEKRLFAYLDNPWSFQLFRGFSVGEGLRNSPELRRLDAAINAQRRTLLSARRAFYLPDVALQASAEGKLAEGGAGSSGSLPLPLALPRPNDLDWQVAIQASIPLFTSGARQADREQAREELEQLRTERAATAERIEQRVRTALHLTGASYPGIELARASAEAARRNYELVAEAYSRGAVSIINLLDAQNAALVAELGAANAVYDFLIDLMEVQRATGRFDFFTSSADRQSWFERLEDYFREQETGPRLPPTEQTQ